MYSREEIMKLPGYPWIVFTIVALGTFMATLDGSIVNVALPTISRDLNANLTVLQWVVTAYLLTISSILPIFGKLGDTVGRKKIYIYGFLAFIVGSVFCGLASSVTFLIVSRVAQAIGAAMMMANNMGIVTSVFPNEQRGRALGSMGVMVAAGSLTGPSLGGFLVTNFSWPSIFFINVPIGIIGFFLGSHLLPKDETIQEKGFDLLGAFLFAGAIVTLLLGLSEGNRVGWDFWPIYLLFPGSLLLFLVFVYHEKRTENPVIDLGLFRDPFFAAGNLAGLISFILLFFTNILMPFYLERVLEYTPAQTGLMLTPVPLALAFIGPLSGRISDRKGPFILTTVGMVVMGLSLALLTNLSLDSSPLEILGKMFLLGTGMALFTSPNNSAIMGSVPRDKLGVVGGLIATVRNVGMLIGVALSVAIFTVLLDKHLAVQQSYKLAFVHSLSKTFWVGVGISIVGVFLSAVRSVNYQKLNNK